MPIPFQTTRPGTALLVVIFVIAIAAAMLTAMMDTLTLQTNALSHTGDYERALYLAGAGAHQALAELEQDFNWRTGVPATQFPSGSSNTYSATAATGMGGTVVVTGIGVAGSFTRKVEVTVGPAE